AQLLGPDRLRGTHIDYDRAGLECAGAEHALHDVAHDRPGRQHGDDHVGRFGQRRRAVGCKRVGLFTNELRYSRLVEIEHRELVTGLEYIVPGLEQVLGHRPAHVADSDEPDLIVAHAPRPPEPALIFWLAAQ